METNKTKEYIEFIPNLISLDTIYLKYGDVCIKFESNNIEYLDKVFFLEDVYSGNGDNVIGTIKLLIDCNIFPRRYNYEEYDDGAFTKKTHPMYIEGMSNEVIESSNQKIYKYHYPNESIHIHNYSDNSFISIVSNINDAIKYSKFAVKQILAQYFSSKNIYPLHAAGVYKDKKGYLFIAGSHSGKTTMYMNLIANGYNPMGDDIVFLQKRNDGLYMYPCPIKVQMRENALPGLKMSKGYSNREMKPLIYIEGGIEIELVFFLSKGYSKTTIKKAAPEQFAKKVLRALSVHRPIPVDMHFLDMYKELMDKPLYELNMSLDYERICEAFDNYLKTL